MGERISTRRGCPLSRLNSVFSVEIEVSEMTLPLCDVVPAPAPPAGDEHDTRTRPAVAAAATAADPCTDPYARRLASRSALLPASSQHGTSGDVVRARLTTRDGLSQVPVHREIRERCQLRTA